MLSNWRKRLMQSYKVNRLRTWLYGMANSCANPRVAFIFGCQRSGTTLLRNFIGLDGRFRDVGEGDPPYFHQEAGERYLRLIDHDDVEALVRSQRSPWVLLKPLHDSQHAARLLKRFEGSKGIWIYRHYSSVIQSHLHYYKHDTLHYLQPLRTLDESSWMLQGLEKEIIEEVGALLKYAGDRDPDLYAVFWYARNAHLFSLLKETELLVLSYEELVLQSAECLRLLNRHLGVELFSAAATVPHQSSLHLAKAITLHPVIQQACEWMYGKLLALSPARQLRPSKPLS